jgi:hypothetical protein
MSNKSISESGQRFYVETAKKLESADIRIVIRTLHELKSTGNAIILPLVLDLFVKNKSEAVIQEVLILIGQLKDQKSVPELIKYVNHKKAGKHLADLISQCWQCGLDFGQYLKVFADTFLTGDYQVALESFTVIEEMLWRSTPEMIEDCRNYLIQGKDKINKDNELLFKELLKVIESGNSQNAEDFPEIFEK